MVECKCTYCNKDFLKKINEYKSSKEHFCTSACYQLYKKNNSPLKNRVKCKCSNCNKELFRVPYDLKRAENVYCNRKCMDEHRIKTNYHSKEKNGNYKGGEVELVCAICKKVFLKSRGAYNYAIKRNKSNTFTCSRDCADKNKGHIVWRDSRKDMTCEHCGIVFKTWESQRIKEYKFCSSKCRKEYFVGDKASSWKGGVHSLQGLIRNTEEYANWRKNVYIRDNFKCAECGSINNLNAHHMKRLSIILEENKIIEITEAMKCKEIWDINNGITVCLSCHAKKHSADRLGGRMCNKKGRRAA